MQRKQLSAGKRNQDFFIYIFRTGYQLYVDIIPPAGFDTCLNSKYNESSILNSVSTYAYKYKFNLSALSGNEVGVG